LHVERPFGRQRSRFKNIMLKELRCEIVNLNEINKDVSFSSMMSTTMKLLVFHKRGIFYLSIGY